jgi:P27 family predicted phage terminase small subunit
MARPGPRPAPSGMVRSQGRRGDRLNSAEPRPAPGTGTPEPPASLCPEAQANWWLLAPDLYAAGVLTHWDVGTFAAYCDLLVQVDRARQGLQAGLVVRARGNAVVTNPLWRIYRDGLVLLRAYAMEFGLTPAARSQIRALPAPRVSPDLQAGQEPAGASLL